MSPAFERPRTKLLNLLTRLWLGCTPSAYSFCNLDAHPLAAYSQLDRALAVFGPRRASKYLKVLLFTGRPIAIGEPGKSNDQMMKRNQLELATGALIVFAIAVFPVLSVAGFALCACGGLQ